uniref:Uncharacterized protein n=1 Tax=Heliothis virescens TaxID=7102 RepID=A0A2A4JLR0_HELVI
MRKSLAAVGTETASAKERKKKGSRKPSVVTRHSERMRKAKVEGLLTPLKGKTPEQKEKILRGLAMKGIPLPEGQTPSEKKLIDKVRTDLGLPIEPKNKHIRDKHQVAAVAGKLFPLEGKSNAEKEKILQDLHDMDIPLPIGRTPSEKDLIAKILAGPAAPSEKMRQAKLEYLKTPLKGKTPAQKEKILKGLAKHGMVLPEGETLSEKKLIDKVRDELGLPPEPKTPDMKKKHAKAAEAGFLEPLEGKTPKEKERILQGLHDLGIHLPEGRTPSEKAIIAKVKAKPPAPSVSLKYSEKMRKAKADGLLTPLKGKTPDQREKVLRGLAMRGIPLPEGQTPSERKLIDKVRGDLGLPIEPKTKDARDKHEAAASAGKLLPLEGKTPAQKEKILRGLRDMNIPLPIGRTPSEKALIAKIMAEPPAPAVRKTKSERMKAAKAAGFLTPLEGKKPEQKEKILRGLAKLGLPLPEGKTPSDKILADKVRAEVGLPPEPQTPTLKEKYAKAQAAGLITPLEGKSPAQKEKILQDLHDMGVPLPEGRTPSEKAIVAKVKAKPRAPSVSLKYSEKMRKAKADGLLTPLKGKTPDQREKILKGLAMRGIPLPEGQTPSERKLIDKVRGDLGLPIEPKTKDVRDKHQVAASAGKLLPLEGKTPAQKEKILRGLHDMNIPLPIGRTPSEKSLIAKIMAEPPASAVRKTKSERLKAAKAAGFLTPLEGKKAEQKEKILRGLAKHGLPLPEGKTPSDKILVDKIRAEVGLPPEPETPSLKEKYAKAQAAGLITPLEGKSPAQKEKILKAQAAMGLSLPEGRTPSEKSLIAKIKAEPTPSITTEKLRKARAAGLLTPLEGKPPKQREKILKGLAKAGLPLPEGKTQSEKALIDKVKKEMGLPDRTPSEKIRHAKATGLLTPLEGKTPLQKEKILRGRAAAGLPLPIGKSPSERALIQKIKADTGYVTPSPSERLQRAKAAGLMTPLKGKTPSVKEKILRNMKAAGVPIPEGETPSEKDLIRKLIAEPPPVTRTQSDKIRLAKAAGLLTPLQGKTPEQKQKILKGLVKAGLPLPEPKTESEKNIIDKIREEVGLPPEPKTPSLQEKYRKAQAAGLITPLEGKTPAEQEKILQKLHDAGIPLPEGRGPSEKALIKKIKGKPPSKTPSEKLKAAKAAGFLTPLEGKTPAQKEKILKGLAKTGIALPEGKTASEKDLISKVRQEMGLPPEPKTPSLREKMQKAQTAGIITPLEGKSPAKKKKILQALADAGIPLPEGRTASEKSLIAKIRPKSKAPSLEGKASPTPSEKSIIRKAKEAGLLTPITGKEPAEKERILKGLAEAGLPLPVGKTASEKDLIKKVRAETGLPPTPTPSEKMGKIKKRAKVAGAAASKKLAKGIEAEEYEDVIKTTTCDRGCGCDKKKIRFKHSYVKIRVTSPDISSFCDCPQECIPGVINGAFIDNEGIKVTVGRVIGIPLYTDEYSGYNLLDGKPKAKHISNKTKFFDNYDKSQFKVCTFDTDATNEVEYVISSSSDSSSGSPYSTESEINFEHTCTPPYQKHCSKSVRILQSSVDLQRPCDMSIAGTLKTKSNANSFNSFFVFKSETSLSLNTSPSNSIDTISLDSDRNSSISCNSTHYSGDQSSDDLVTLSSLDSSMTSENENTNKRTPIRTGNVKKKIVPPTPQHEYTVYRMSQTKINFTNTASSKTKKKPEADEPVVVLNRLPTKIDLTKLVGKILKKKQYAGVSSIFVVIPTSDDDTGDSVESSKNSNASIVSSESHIPDENENIKSNETIEVIEKVDEIVGTDVTTDIPCRCQEGDSSDIVVHECCSKGSYVANVMSKQSIPQFLKGKVLDRLLSANLSKESEETRSRDIPPCSDLSTCYEPSETSGHLSDHHRHEDKCPAHCGCISNESEIIKTHIASTNTEIPDDNTEDKKAGKIFPFVGDRGLQRSGSSNVYLPKSLKDVKRSYSDLMETSTIVKNIKRCICTGYSRLSGIEVGTPSSTVPRISENLSSLNHSSPIQLTRKQWYNQATSLSERQVTIQHLSQEESCACDGVKHFGDDTNQIKKSEKSKADCACQVVDGQDFVIPQKNTNDVPLKKLALDSPRERTTQSIPFEKTALDLPRQNTGQNLPCERSAQVSLRERTSQTMPLERLAQDLHRERKIHNIPVEKTTQHLPCERSAQDSLRENTTQSIPLDKTAQDLTCINQAQDLPRERKIHNIPVTKTVKDLLPLERLAQDLHRQRKIHNIPVEKTAQHLTRINQAQDVPCETSAQDALRERTTQSMPLEKTAQDLTRERSAPDLHRERKIHNIPVERTAQSIPCERSAQSIPCERSVQSISCERSAQSISCERSTQSIPCERSTQSIPLEKTAPDLPLERSAENLHRESKMHNIPVERTAHNLPLEKPAQTLPCDITAQNSQRDNLDKADDLESSSHKKQIHKSQNGPENTTNPKINDNLLKLLSNLSKTSISNWDCPCFLSNDSENPNKVIISNSNSPTTLLEKSLKRKSAIRGSDSKIRSKKKSIRIVDPKSEQAPLPGQVPEVQTIPGTPPSSAPLKATSSRQASKYKQIPQPPQAMSATSDSDADKTPQSQPLSSSQGSPQPHPMNKTDQNSQSLSEQNPQSVPTSKTKSSTHSTLLPQPLPINETKQPQQLSLPPQHMQPAAETLPPEGYPPEGYPPEGYPLEGNPPEGYPYEESGPSCGWIDMAKAMRLTSEWSQYTSGFKACKKKQKPKVVEVPQEEIELDFEDAVKYYATTHPELFRDLMQQELRKKLESETEAEQSNDKEGKKLKKGKKKERKDSFLSKKSKKETEKEKIKKGKKASKKGNSMSDSDEEVKKKNPYYNKTCDCPYGPIPPPIRYETTSESPEELERYPRGLKMSLGGKGSASPGLKNLACFKMTREYPSSSTVCNQESLISW